MEMRYDPVSDTTDYTEMFRATCPVCGIERTAAVSVPGVPRDTIDPAVHSALDALMADKLERTRARFLSDLPPRGVCSPQP
jgi:hypothetical protein